MGKWFGGIAGAVIAGLILWWLTGPQAPWSDEPDATTIPADAHAVKTAGFRTERLEGVHLPPGDPDEIRHVFVNLDLDTGTRDDGPNPDIELAIDADNRIAWIQATHAAEARPEPSYDDCAADLEGAGHYIQENPGRPTVCVRTNEGRVSVFEITEIPVFRQPGEDDFYNVDVEYEFRTWTLNP